MKTHNIEFNPPSENPIGSISPWASPVKSTYQDLILKPEFQDRKYKFPSETTWFRIIPALRGSEKDWMLGVHALNYPGGRHMHARTLKPGAMSVFDQAFAWLKQNRKEALFSKQNRDGYRLLADPVCVFWFLIEIDGKTVARLFVGNGYDGSRGGMPSLGHQIWQMTREVDEDGNPAVNPVDAETGVQISVEKRQSKGARYPSCTLRPGRIAVPIRDMLEKMDPVEVSALAPLEQVVHLPTEEEEWELLANVIDPETIREIRASIE